MKTYIVKLTYKIKVQAPDEFNAEEKARSDIDSFTSPDDVWVLEQENDEETKS